ncbi:cupredoxin domain-containing protein [Bizionia myxarmorum]|uniref:EfeO-type cupredoxin-like domain-containing protein n=1 Tax=Bizionia myxarmorum TaxID=291186 RepID=A0A5D0QXS8_9FLAO|nr:cupredoxin domain-containing protein [Bizionia myxarmorum]TYB74013.1 hypothetical protein ES674_14710 [Bizionia myxarmorum]
MKAITTVLLMSLFVLSSCGQDKNEGKENGVQTISLEQTDGEFKQKTLTLKEGTYVFEIANKDVAHEVGFVLAPKGNTDEANHIKAAYVTEPVKTGSTSKTKEVTLKKGEYVYFCPLNPTPEYTLLVN